MGNHDEPVDDNLDFLPPGTGNFSTIQDAETAMVIWKIFHTLSNAALLRSNEIKRDKIERMLKETKEMTLNINRRLWRLEMKKKGVIQGGGEKRKNRKKPKLKLIKM